MFYYNHDLFVSNGTAMSEHRKEESQQYRQGEQSGEIGEIGETCRNQPGQSPGVVPGQADGPPELTAGQAGSGYSAGLGAAAAGEARAAAMGGAPRPGYFYGDSPGAMGYPPYPPPTAAPFPPPYYVASHPAYYPGAGYWGPPAGIYSQYPPAGTYPGVEPNTAGMYAGQGAHGAHGAHGGQGMHAPMSERGRSDLGVSDLVREISNGGSGLSSLGKMLDLDDSEFWKGALIGAAAVLLLTNESVQNMIFKTGAKAKDAMTSGIEKVKETAKDVSKTAKE